MFKYFKDGDLASENGQVMRVLAENVQPYFEAKLVNGEPKYKEVAFEDWKVYAPKEWESPEGLLDPEYGLLDENGEPVPDAS